MIIYCILVQWRMKLIIEISENYCRDQSDSYSLLQIRRERKREEEIQQKVVK